MPTYQEVYEEDQGKRRHYQRLLNAGKATNGECLACWVFVVGSLVFLWMIRRGFRGVGVGGINVGVS